MNSIAKALQSSLFLLFLTACSEKEIGPPEDPDNQHGIAVVNKNINYGLDAQQTYDLYLPANRSSSTTKILVFIHGGGWIQGDKRDMRAYIPLLQKTHPDHALVNINYRLAKLHTRTAFPNQFLDLKLALEHITLKSEEFGIHPEFGLIGASAGGHLALQYDNFYDSHDQVKMVCSIVGPTDLTDPFYSENPDFDFALDMLIDESAYPGVRDYAKAVSPVFLVNPNSSATILFYGDEDLLVPVSNGTFLKEKLDAAGVINSLTIYNGGHGDWENLDQKDLHLKLSEFINDHLPIQN